MKLKSFTEDPWTIASYGPLANEAGRRFKIKLLGKPHSPVPGGVLRAEIEGVTDRNAAEALRGTRLFVDRDALPAPTAPGEYYQADLIGLDVFDETGAPFGRVVTMRNFGGGDLLEIEARGGERLFAPFSDAAVPEIDLARSRLVIDRLAAFGPEADRNLETGDDPEGGA